MKHYTIFTDGACNPNPGPGGWGAIIKRDNKLIELSGGQYDTTNNQMEILAPIKALAYLKEQSKVMLFSDSRYVIDGVTKWSKNWIKNDWKRGKKNKEDVKNKDLWIELLAACALHDVEWCWVKGHSGVILNEMADKLAGAAIPRTTEKSP